MKYSIFTPLLSCPHSIVISLIATLMLIAVPQNQGWSMEPLGNDKEKEEHYPNPSPKLQKRTVADSPSTARRTDVTPTDIRNTSVYSGPQWGLCDAEIEYLFKNSKDFVCITEYGGHFIRLNQTWSLVLGWEIQELLQTPYINFVHPEDVQKTLEYENGDAAPAGLTNRYRCKDGSYRWLDWIGLSRTSKGLTTMERGNPLCIARDITLHKVIENEYQERLKILSDDQWHLKQRILEAITEIQADHICGILYDGEQHPANRVLQVILRNFIKLSGSRFGFICEISSDRPDISHIDYVWGGDSLVGEGDASSPHNIEAAKKWEQLSNTFVEDIVLKKGHVIVKNIELNPDLLTFQSFFGVPIIFQGKLVGVVGLFNCATCCNEIYMELLNPIFLLSARVIHEKQTQVHQLSQRRAEAEIDVKSTFLAHMSHEIRTPLTGLLGTLELINQDHLNEEDLNYLKTARGSGLALLSILNDILDISKIEAGQLKLENISFNPISVVHEVAHLLSIDADKKGVDLKLTTSPQVPPSLLGDPTRLRQILFNLVGNAIKFTSQGSVHVSVDGVYDSSHFILVGSVVDTGIGVSLEAQERLFKPFTQADTSMLRRFGGTGLGLFITKKLCEMMGGDVSVHSEVGKGSTFSFKVKLGRSHELRMQAGTPSSENLPTSLPNIRILVAEDNAVNQLVLKALLTKAGCSVTTVWNGKEAVEAVGCDHFDLVLMDGEMPIMDGFKATQKIRQTFSAQMLPIIAVTAHAMVGDREKFLNAGMNSYLTKPIQRDGLFTEILKCMALKEIK